MKRIYLLLCLLPFAVSLSAQKLDGTWIADKEFKEVFELDDEETSMDMFLNFKEEKMTIAFHIMSEDSDVGTIDRHGGRYSWNVRCDRGRSDRHFRQRGNRIENHYVEPA